MLFVADTVGLDAVRWAGLRSRLAGWRLGRAGVERGKRLAQAVGFAGELIKALLNLFTQTVDHVGSMWVAVPGRARSYTSQHGAPWFRRRFEASA
ncbi:MAG: hypothetical protein ACLPTJ_15015 [Solirubrobacteraceae bacterium]